MRPPREKKALDPARAADSNAAHTAAIALLARRDHSAADITRKLEERGYDWVRGEYERAGAAA